MCVCFCFQIGKTSTLVGFHFWVGKKSMVCAFQFPRAGSGISPSTRCPYGGSIAGNNKHLHTITSVEMMGISGVQYIDRFYKMGICRSLGPDGEAQVVLSNVKRNNIHCRGWPENLTQMISNDQIEVSENGATSQISNHPFINPFYGNPQESIIIFPLSRRRGARRCR